MKYKEFYMPVSCLAMAESFHAQARILGYSFTNCAPINPVGVKFYCNGLYSFIDEKSMLSGECFCWYTFFTLTPEDVRVEPERFPCEIFLKGKMGSRHVGNLQQPQRLEYSDDGYCELTQDQIDRIKEVMNES